MSKSKKSKLRLPKRIAGVKIPKAARKGPVADFLNSSGGQVLLAEALVLAAGLFGVRQMNKSAAEGGNGEGVRENLAEASARLSHACAEALRAFRAALAEPVPVVAEAFSESDSDQLPETTVDEEVSVPKKKRGTSRSESARVTN